MSTACNDKILPDWCVLTRVSPSTRNCTDRWNSKMPSNVKFVFVEDGGSSWSPATSTARGAGSERDARKALRAETGWGCDEDDEDLTDAATCWWPTFEGPGVSSFKGSSFKDAKNLKQLWSDQHDCVEADKTNWQHVQQKDDQIA